MHLVDIVQDLAHLWCQRVRIPTPTVYYDLSVPAYGYTTQRYGETVVGINPLSCQSREELLVTLGHELIHCWQFEHQPQQDIDACEDEAYTYEQLAAVSLCAIALAEGYTD